jgi:hypothetical protein
MSISPCNKCDLACLSDTCAVNEINKMVSNRSSPRPSQSSIVSPSGVTYSWKRNWVSKKKLKVDATDCETVLRVLGPAKKPDCSVVLLEWSKLVEMFCKNQFVANVIKKLNLLVLRKFRYILRLLLSSFVLDAILFLNLKQRKRLISALI